MSALSSNPRQTRLSTPHGFREDERSRLLRARPPAQVLAWVEASLGGAVTRIRALKGGSSSAMHALRLRTRKGDETVVLRRYVLLGVLSEEPDIAEREARVLDVLRPLRLPTPRLLALDPTGAEAGVPAVVMSRLPGRVLWEPAQVDPWLRGLVDALAPLHDAVLTPDHGIADFRPYPPERWQAPPWLRRPALWDRALDVFGAAPLDSEKVLIHRDYHPGNVHWRRGKVSGVIDWQAASMGPPSVDLAWCRLNVLGRLGLEVADRLPSRWE